MVSGAAALEGGLIAAQSELSGLRQIYTPNNVRVRFPAGPRRPTPQQTDRTPGSSRTPWVEGGKSTDLGIPIAKLPVLGLQFYDLVRKAKIQETVFEILSRINWQK